MKNFVYGNSQGFFLQPLKGYGIPEVQPGATRKARLYVVYSHRLDKVYGSPQLPVIEIGGVRFELPRISGGWDNVGANWSNFRTYAEYGGVGHTTMGIYFDGLVSPSTEPIGVVERVEAYFYDEFPE
ncbi:MAG: hypothetical protein HY673_22540 [Chloroflexi bacterium]|nr:hypothetical protein [Chloroflexota bacterium]